MKKAILLTVLVNLPFWVMWQFNISGTVKDSLTGESFSGAQITIENTYNFAVSGQDGTFEFTD